MIKVYIHMYSIEAYLNYEPVQVITMFPSKDYVELYINPKDVKMLIQTSSIYVTKNKPFIRKIKDWFKRNILRSA